jgi:predicted dehydrogenase
MDKVRLGVVGVGWWGGVLADAARETGLADVVLCFARSADAREAFAHQRSCRAVDTYDALLGDQEVDGVLLATPHSTHIDLIERAAAAGKHIFVEKPLALTVDDARRAIAATSAAGVILQVGYQRRRQPTNRKIKELIDGGSLGTLVQLEGNQSGPAAHNAEFPVWRADAAEVPAGGMTAMGVHVVDTFQYFAGPARRVASYSKQVRGWRALDEATTVMIEYEDGPLGYVGTSYYVPAVNTLVAYGSDMNAWNEQDGSHLWTQQRGESLRTEQPTEVIDVIADEMAEFAHCILEGTEPETGGAESLEVAAILEAIVRSAATGRTVELSEIR